MVRILKKIVSSVFLSIIPYCFTSASAMWSAASFHLDAVCKSLEIALRKSLENVLFADILQMQLHQIIIFITGKQKSL